jgi:cytochrome c-type biogenesis protein
MSSLIALYGLSFLGGLLSFFSPCLIPMVTVYFSIITGMSVEDLKSVQSRRLKKKILANTLFFIAAFTLVFTLAGGASSTIGSLIKKNIGVLNVFGGAFIILFGLRMLGLTTMRPFHINHKLLNLKLPPVGYLRAFLVGIFFAVACSHCIGPTLYSFLMLAGTMTAAGQGMMLMFIFSIGLAIPYLVLALAFEKYFDKLKAFMKTRIPQIVLGVTMVVLGIAILTGNFTKITRILYEILPYKLPFGM